jgi:hypothetical protein
MRAIVLAIVAIQIGSGHLARADNSPASDRSIRETLPLFEKIIVEHSPTRQSNYFVAIPNSTTRPRG